MGLWRRIQRLERAGSVGPVGDGVGVLLSEPDRRAALLAFYGALDIPGPLVDAAVDDTLSDPSFPTMVLSGDRDQWAAWVESVVARGLVGG